MSKISFEVNISPEKALQIVKGELNADLVYEELRCFDENKVIGTLVFQKYYMRAGNKAALVVIADNIDKVTSVRAVATGSSRDVFFNFDLGAAGSFANSVKDILTRYIE